MRIGAGFMVRGLPAEAVLVSATPSAVVTIPELSNGRDEKDSNTWQQVTSKSIFVYSLWLVYHF